MHSGCKNVCGLLVLIGGLSFLAFGLKWWNVGLLVHLVAGAAFSLYGLAKLAHAMHMCPACKDAGCCCGSCEMEAPKGKKK
ncbi:MAG: hypothetical protein Q8P02_01805 [Candidatus Micrarchaeota archaeon]|nr:hypothetical protein [Candidatus Micrarchaeota archaeon]